jgi:glycosyltransferase involved in cell wall biosynthesis
VKILIAAASFASNMSGLQRHALNLVRCLLPESDISALHLVIAPWQVNFVQAAALRQDARLVVHVAEMDRNSLSRNLWYYRRLPGLATQLQTDVVHLSYPMPIDASAFGCPTMVTLHDLYPYEIPMNFGFPKFIFNRAVLQQCLRNVAAIACVSDITLLRLKQYTSAGVWQKALRIYNCVEAGSARDMKSPVSELQNQRFLLSVAQHRRNKNIPLLIRAFAGVLRTGQVAPDMKLVVIGITGPETPMIRRLVSILGLAESVCFLEGVSESELQWCYTQCEAVVSPSITEGFGLPVAEALLAGCRIVCSDIPAFREVGDEQCRFVALKEKAEETLAAAIVASLNDPKGTPKPLQQFSASVLAKQYLGLYRKLIFSGKPSGECQGCSINSRSSFRKAASMKKKDALAPSLKGGDENERI